MTRILIFTDEYHYVSRGLFNVFVSQSKVMSEYCDVVRGLNAQHWGLQELMSPDSEDSIPIRVLPITEAGKLFFLLANIATSSKVAGVFKVLGGLLNALFWPVTLARTYRYLAILKVDLVIIHNGGWPGGYLSRALSVACKAYNKPAVMVLHNYPSTSQSAAFTKLIAPLRKLQNYIGNRVVSVFIAVSKDLYASLRSYGLKNVSVILNGIDLEQHQLISHATKRSESEVVVVGFAGALVDRKGVQTLIKAFSKMHENAKLLIVGDGPQRHMLEDMAKATERKIEFSGHSDNVLSQLTKMDILVVPSESFESFGMVILEGMAVKLPLVISDCGGMKEIVVDEVTGLVFPAGDDYSLARTLDRLVHNPKEREVFGTNGYERLIKGFSTLRVNSNYLEIVEQVLESKPEFP